jgi:DNA-binding transcriptional ArsR family regulator
MSASPSLDESLIKALAHPLRWRLLEVLIDRGEASPVQLARLLDEPLATVSHHMRVLRDTRCVRLTRTEPRRGAVEHYYQPLMPAFFDDERWTQLPTTLRRGYAGQVFRRIFEEAAQAGTAGAFDGPNAHITRMLIELDDRGRRELSELLEDVLRKAQAIQERSDARQTEVRLSEIALLHFEPADVTGEVAPRKRSPPLP